ncbi:MAG TPA: co-chaperone GroES [Planctomycetota bacterium]|jgi:chaperonin GroES|nr:co-chaperone GroES [Planctomycetota bacterium]
MAKTKTATTVSIKPLGDHVLVRRLEAEDKTKGGIVLPDTAKEKPKEGVVIAVGQGRTLETGERVPPSVKPENRVLFSSYAGTEVKWEGEEYLLIREEDILGVVEG